MRWCAAVVMLASCAPRNPFEVRAADATVRVETTFDVSITMEDAAGERTTSYAVVKREVFRRTARGIVFVEGAMQRTTLDRPSNAESVGGWEDYAQLMPDRSVAEGAEWRVKADFCGLIGWRLADTIAVDGVARLRRVDGPRAWIEFAGTVEGWTRDGSLLRVVIPEAKGELVFDTATGLAESIRVDAELETAKDVMAGGVKIGEIRSKTSKFQVRIAFEGP